MGHLLWLVVGVDDESPADQALRWCVLMMVLRWKGLVLVRCDLSGAPLAAIDAGERSRRPGLVNVVESLVINSDK